MSRDACATSDWVISTNRAVDRRFKASFTVLADRANCRLSHACLVTVEASRAREASRCVVVRVIGLGRTLNIKLSSSASVMARSGWVLVRNTAPRLTVPAGSTLSCSIRRRRAITVVTWGTEGAVRETLHVSVEIVVAGGTVRSLEAADFTISTRGAVILFRHDAARVTVKTSIAKASWSLNTGLSTVASFGADGAVSLSGKHSVGTKIANRARHWHFGALHTIVACGARNRECCCAHAVEACGTGITCG